MLRLTKSVLCKIPSTSSSLSNFFFSLHSPKALMSSLWWDLLQELW
jgi:hypothetical protein